MVHLKVLPLLVSYNRGIHNGKETIPRCTETEENTIRSEMGDEKLLKDRKMVGKVLHELQEVTILLF